MNYQIISDGSCDINDELILKHNIDVVPFYLSFDEINYIKEKEDVSVLDFYKQMVDNPNVFPKTSMPTIDDYLVKFRKYAEQGINIICICITTKFSGSFNSASAAKEEILKEYPNIKIEVIDAMINTCIQGVLVLEAARMKENNVEFDEAVRLINEIKLSARIFFTIGNMDYLRHGGRIGKLKGLIGATLKIKPLIVLKEGEIFPLGIAFTRKQAMVKVVSHVKKFFEDAKLKIKDYFFITGCGINQEDLPRFDDLIKHALGDVEIMNGQIGATIGVHTGPYPLGIGFIKKYDA